MIKVETRTKMLGALAERFAHRNPRLLNVPNIPINRQLLSERETLIGSYRAVTNVPSVVIRFGSTWLGITVSNSTEYRLTDIATGSMVSKTSFLGGEKCDWRLKDIEYFENNSKAVEYKRSRAINSLNYGGISLEVSFSQYPQINHIIDLNIITNGGF